MLPSAKLVCVWLCLFWVALRDEKSYFCLISFLVCATYFVSSALSDMFDYVWVSALFPNTFAPNFLNDLWSVRPLSAGSKRSPQTTWAVTQYAAHAGNHAVRCSQKQIDQSGYRSVHLRLCLPVTWLLYAVTEKFLWKWERSLPVAVAFWACFYRWKMKLLSCLRFRSLKRALSDNGFRVQRFQNTPGFVSMSTGKATVFQNRRTSSCCRIK